MGVSLLDGQTHRDIEPIRVAAYHSGAGAVPTAISEALRIAHYAARDHGRLVFCQGHGWNAKDMVAQLASDYLVQSTALTAIGGGWRRLPDGVTHLVARCAFSVGIAIADDENALAEAHLTATEALGDPLELTANTDTGTTVSAPIPIDTINRDDAAAAIRTGGVFALMHADRSLGALAALQWTIIQCEVKLTSVPAGGWCRARVEARATTNGGATSVGLTPWWALCWWEDRP